MNGDRNPLKNRWGLSLVWIAGSLGSLHAQTAGEFPQLLPPRETVRRVVAIPVHLQSQDQAISLPPAEPVIPLPAVPAPSGFEGFGERKGSNAEEIPSPNLPPRYVPPIERSREKERMDPNSSLLPSERLQGIVPFEPIRPLSEYQGVERLWMPTGPLKEPPPQEVAKAGYTPEPPPLHQPWTFVTGDEKRQLDALAFSPPPAMACGANEVPYVPFDFSPTPAPIQSWSPADDYQSYYGKVCVPTQRPWVEWWRPFYSGGIFAPAIPVLSDVNPLTPQFLVFGDYRSGVGIHRDGGVANRNWAHRLNLEADLRLTGTERIHAFMGPLDRNGQFTRLDFSDRAQFETELDATLDTVFFEGDAGAIVGGARGVDAPFDLPFTFGLVPLLYQNGIWMEDAIAGFAFGFPWRHSLPFNWSNYDATFFAGFSDVTSQAFANDNGGASVYGTAWFIEAYQGYIEADYAFLHDQDRLNRDHHNFAVAFSRRYWHTISNSIRLIANFGQEGARVDRTADGGLLLFENSWISGLPSTVVPYSNLFYGYGRPQSVARANGSGGILRNTGINFESDGLTGYPTLDATGSNAYGGAVGINLLSADFRRQWAVEFAALDTYGDDRLSAARGPQYGLGTRWQRAITNASLLRLDVMSGWLDHAPDIYGSRIEYRWKF